MDKSAIIAKFKADPLLLGKVCVPTMFRLATPPFHREITDAYLEPGNKNLVIIAPRGHAKSSLVACVLVLHHILFEPGKKVILLVSKTNGHAERLLQTIKDVLDYSAPFRAFFGYWGQHSAKRWTNSEVVLRDDTLILTRGTGQQVVGIKHGNQRPTLNILDDPEDTENTKTLDAMEKNLRWLFTQLIPTRDAQRGRTIVIGTPQHQRCMVEVLMKAHNWTKLRYKAIQDDGTALWPEQWPVEKLLEEKATAESLNRVSMWYREYQCQILSDEEQLFRESDIQNYKGKVDFTVDGPVLEMEDGRRIPVNIFMGIDPAVSTGGTSDYTVIMPIAIDAENNRYILPFTRKRMTPNAVIDEVVRLDALWKPLRIRIETSGQQEIYADVLRNLVRKSCMLVTFKPKDSKTKRYLDSLEPYFVRKKVFILPEQTELKDELLQYRSDGRHQHDDMIDAMFYAFKNAYQPDRTVEQKKDPFFRKTKNLLSWEVS